MRFRAYVQVCWLFLRMMRTGSVDIDGNVVTLSASRLSNSRRFRKYTLRLEAEMRNGAQN